MHLHSLKAPLCAAAVLLSTTAVAGPFASGNLALTSTKFDNIKSGVGYSLSAGYSFDSLKYPVFVEGSLYDSGALKVKDADVKLRYDGFQFFGGVAYRLPSAPWVVWGKAGVYSLDQKASGLVSEQEKGSGASLGLGADWLFHSQLGLRVEIETPFAVRSFNDNGSGKTQLSVIKFGLVWRPSFGGSRVEAPAPPPEATVTTAVVAPIVQAEAPKATALANGQSAIARSGTGIRAQPKTDSRLLSTLSADTVVTLNGSSSNSSGDWWYVKSAGLAGWVLASELVTP